MEMPMTRITNDFDLLLASWMLPVIVTFSAIRVHWKWFLIITAALAAGLVATAEPVRLPVANFDGYQTTVFVDNPSFETIQLFDLCQIGPCAAVAPFTTAPVDYGTKRDGILELELGKAGLPYNPGLQAYSEIRDPNGIVTRVRPLGPARTQPTQLMNIKNTGGFKTFLFLFSADGGTFKVTARQNNGAPLLQLTMTLAPGETKVQEIPVGNRVVIEQGYPWGGLEGSFDALALVSHQPAGELLVIYPQHVVWPIAK